KRLVHHPRNHAEVRTGHVSTFESRWIGKVRMIENVVTLGCDVDLPTLGDRDHAAERQIALAEGEPAQRVPAQVSLFIAARNKEGILIQAAAARHRAVREPDRFAVPIGPDLREETSVRAAGIRRVTGIAADSLNIERKTAAGGSYKIQVPV